MAERVLPPEVLESHIGIMGKTGSGKSNLAKVVVEGLLEDGQRVCIIDPTGTWYGLRLTRDRKPSPYQVVMFGGQHQDIAIDRAHGAAVAETIGTTTTPAVIDTRGMTVGARTLFFTDFAETLLQRNQGVLHLVVDEAHLFAPQGRVPDPKSGEMVNAANNLVSLGRGIGLRIILISQRPAKLHKDSLTQIETLITMRLIAPQDRGAIEDWVREVADPAMGREMISSLAKLPTGTGWVWSPEADIFERRRFPLASTLDTGRPNGEPVQLSPIDVDAVQERLGQFDKDAIANDPRTLKARIAALERQLGESRPQGGPESPQLAARLAELESEHLNDVDEIHRLTAALHDAEEQLANYANAVIGRLQHVIDDAHAMVEFVDQEGGQSHVPQPPRAAAPVQKVPSGVPAPSERPTVGRATPIAVPVENGEVPLGKAHRLILAALAAYPTGLTRTQLAFLADYHPNAKGYTNALGALRSQGLVTAGFPAELTDAGKALDIGVDALPTGLDLVEYWLSRFGRAERAILTKLAHVYPESVARVELAATAGFEHPNSKGYTNALGRLRGLGLVDGFALHRDFAALVGR